MARAPVASRGHADLAWIGFGIGNELAKCPGRKGWMHHHDVGYSHDARGWRDVADEIEIEFVIERRVERIRRTDQEERIAIRGRTHDRLGANIGAAPRPVL